MEWRPTLLSSCALAATSTEARFRIDGPTPTPRLARVIALDDGAAKLVEDVASLPWQGASFLTLGKQGEEAELLTVDRILREQNPDVILRTIDGSTASLRDELDSADMILMVATGGSGAEAAAIIGRACFEHRTMTAALALTDGQPDGASAVEPTVAMLRPYATVLLVSSDPSDLPELLTALRA